jgi:hypothetical protein
MKRALHLLGLVVAVVALGYFAAYAWRALAGQDLSRLVQPRVLTAGGVLTALYVLLVPMTALAWSWLLKGLGRPAPVSITAPVLAATQVGKYLPGNIAHHVGRVGLAHAHGLDAGRTILSMAYETLLLLVACAHVSALTFLWHPPPALADWPLAQHHGAMVAAISLGALAMIMAAPLAARAVARLRGRTTIATGDARESARPDWPTCLACYLLYTANFALVGAGLWLVARTLSPTAISPEMFVLLTGAFAASWILGFLAPGAPAGLGVREAVLGIWLGTAFAAPVAVSLVIVLRIATTLGDLVNFLWGSLALARLRRPQ